VDEPVATLVEAVVAAAQDRLPAAAHDRAALGGLETWREAMRIVQAREVWASFGEFSTRHRPNLGSGIRERMEIAARISDDQVSAARDVTAQATQRMHDLTVPGTVLALPTAPSIAPPLAGQQAGVLSRPRHAPRMHGEHLRAPAGNNSGRDRRWRPRRPVMPWLARQR